MRNQHSHKSSAAGEEEVNGSCHSTEEASDQVSWPGGEGVEQATEEAGPGGQVSRSHCSKEEVNKEPAELLRQWNCP